MKKVLYNDLYMINNDLNGHIKTEKVSYGLLSSKKAKRRIDKTFKNLKFGKVLSRTEIKLKSGDNRETRYKYAVVVDWGTSYTEYTYMTAILKV